MYSPIFRQAKEAAAQGLMDKLGHEAEKERLSQQKERAVLLKFQQKSEVLYGLYSVVLPVLCCNTNCEALGRFAIPQW